MYALEVYRFLTIDIKNVDIFFRVTKCSIVIMKHMTLVQMHTFVSYIMEMVVKDDALHGFKTLEESFPFFGLHIER